MQERQTPETVARLAGSVGNHEGQAIVYLIMRGDDRVYFSGDLYRAFLTVQESHPVWDLTRQHLLEYCEKSFIPAGLVQRIQDPLTGRHGYKRLEEENQAVAFTGLMLSLSERYPRISLSQLLGKTPPPITAAEGTSQLLPNEAYRPQLIRLKIYEALLSKTPITIRALAETIQEKPYIAEKYIEQFTEDKIVLPRFRRPDEPYATYQFITEAPREDLRQHGHNQKLAQELYKIMMVQTRRLWTRDVILSSLLAGNPAMRMLKRESLLVRVSSVLAQMERDDDIQVSRNQGVVLSKKQKAVIEDLLTIFERFQKQDAQIMEEGVTRAEEIITNPQRVTKLLLKARESSRRISGFSAEETEDQILYLIATHRNRNSQAIRRFLEDDFGRRLAGRNLWQILQILREKNLIQIADKKTASYWAVGDAFDEEMWHTLWSKFRGPRRNLQR